MYGVYKYAIYMHLYHYNSGMQTGGVTILEQIITLHLMLAGQIMFLKYNGRCLVVLSQSYLDLCSCHLSCAAGARACWATSFVKYPCWLILTTCRIYWNLYNATHPDTSSRMMDITRAYNSATPGTPQLPCVLPCIYINYGIIRKYLEWWIKR